MIVQNNMTQDKDNAVSVERAETLEDVLKERDYYKSLCEKLKETGKMTQNAGRLIDANSLEEKIKTMCESQATVDGIIKSGIAEVLYYLENETTVKHDLPETPIECAKMLIDVSFECEASPIQKAFGAGEKAHMKYYTTDDLRQIAEHLLVHCTHIENDKED